MMRFLLATAIAGAATIVAANDFPTAARVEYVLGCLQENAGPRQEMIYKCTCAADAVAEQVKYDEWVDLSTFANAASIAGERGAALRDRKDTRDQVGRYREVQAKAKKSCFIGPPQ